LKSKGFFCSVRLGGLICNYSYLFPSTMSAVGWQRTNYEHYDARDIRCVDYLLVVCVILLFY